MRQNYCDRCGRPIKDPNAKYGWRCAEIVAAGGSLTVDLSAVLTMLEKYADFSFDAQRDLFEVFGIFNKMLTFASSPYLLQAEEDYVEKGAGLAYAMFSNYENLNTDEKKSAVSHFISEMQMADDTLPLPITKPSFSERINMELQNYYAAKNNPDTNDTVEDSIDAFFGNIPLYNYLNAIFAPTERERKRNLIRGIESSLRAIENLPYTSSMMGDISIVHPYPAVVPDVQPYADTTPEPYPPAADSAGNYLPNVNKVRVDTRKVTHYALNPNNLSGGADKAKVFESALGYNQSNATQLIEQIQSKLPKSEAVVGNLDKYGQRFTVDIPITGPNGRTAIVRTGWILEHGSDVPRMTTLFVK